MSAVSIPTHTGSTFELQGPIVVHDRRVTVDGITAQYLEAGTGPTLLLLHGHEQSATSWRWVIPALARTHRVLALSLPGHGDTAPSSTTRPAGVMPRSSPTFSTPSASAVDAPGRTLRGWRDRHQVGARRPGRVRTLALVDSAGLGREVHPLLALDTLPSSESSRS